MNAMGEYLIRTDRYFVRRPISAAWAEIDVCTYYNLQRLVEVTLLHIEMPPMLLGFDDPKAEND